MEKKLRIVSASISDRGLSEKRQQNEDAFLEMGHFGLYAVADGVGGSHGGEVASQMAVEILSEAFENRPEGADVEEVLRVAIEQANTAIYQMAQEIPNLCNMATTIVALHIEGSIATIGHVGDSRLYRVGPTGSLYQETEDHSMVAEEVRAGRMTEEQAVNHPSRNIISRALGAEPIVDVDLNTMMIEPGTAFLICSDGITRHVSDDEIRTVLTTGGDPTEICKNLKGLCYERGAEDNLTAVVIKVGTGNLNMVETANESQVDDEEITVSSVRSPFDNRPRGEEILDDDAEYAKVFVDTDEFPYIDKQSPETQGVVERVHYDKKPDSLGKVIAAVGMLLLGGLIGVGVYHFLFVTATSPQSSEIKTENAPMTSFEKLRRTVDSDPAAYLKEVPPAEDANDFYLLGRAYLLTGDFSKARLSLLEAQKQIGKTDISNAKVLATDIATALVITNDPEAQKQLRSDIENISKPSANNFTNVTR